MQTRVLNVEGWGTQLQTARKKVVRVRYVTFTRRSVTQQTVAEQE